MCFLSAGADGQGASPRRSREHSQKRNQNRCRALASLESCQTIPVKALFWWRPELEAFGECKERKMYTERGRERERATLTQRCALVCEPVTPVRRAPRLQRAGMIAMKSFELTTIYLGM